MSLATWETLRRMAILAVAYFAAGTMALHLAIPPGSPAAAWPPAGIALAGLLLHGRRLWPAVAVGSVAVNLGASVDLSDGWALWRSLVLAFGFGCGASLHAVAGATLVRRVLGTPLELLREQDVAKFFVLAGPISALLSASIGVGALLATRSILPDHALYTWSIWWVGDSIGAVVVAPLVLVWLAEPREVWRRRSVPVTVPLACLTVATVLLFFWVRELEAARLRSEFQKQAERVTDAVESSFDRATRLVRSFAGLYETLPDADQPGTFSAFATRTLATNPEIRALSWNPKVSAGERASFERRARLAGYLDFRVTERATSGATTARPRDEYVPVLHIEPSASNRAARGFDVASEPARAAALGRACATGRTSMTGPVRLVQDDASSGHGVVVFVPVYRDSKPTEPEDRCWATRGFVAGVFQLEDVMRSALGAQPDRRVTVALQEASDEGGSVVWSDAAGVPPIAPRGLSRAGLVEAAGRKWSVLVTMNPSYDVVNRTWRPWIALAAGMLFISLLSALLLVVTGRPIVIERLSAARAAELSEINRRREREIAERREAEQALLANEAKLQQAGKMEAIGRLAGGVAHDFNNLLTVILGYSLQVLEQVGPASPIAGDVREIQQAGESAARLTEQLLAFSRRQVLTPVVLDVNQEIDRLRGLIARLVGEDVTLVVTSEAGRCHVKVDRGFVEQVLFNLAANARDAMRQGGTLTVTTTALDLREPRTEDGVIVPAGQYLVLSVADTGVGMVASTRAHVFEPFFSTKGHRGTGLGLATVYGLVEQSGGLITVDSEPDRGTCFRVYLPTVDDAPTAGPLLYHRPAVAPSAHILLVEDDDGVRYLVSTLLRREGYSVVEAGHPADGLRLAQSSARPFQLLISDMVMPGMHGRALAENVTRLHPDAGILFITGYADQVVDAGHALLQKPFTSDEILWNVRETLRRAPAAGRASDTAIAG